MLVRGYYNAAIRIVTLDDNEGIFRRQSLVWMQSSANDSPIIFGMLNKKSHSLVDYLIGTCVYKPHLRILANKEMGSSIYRYNTNNYQPSCKAVEGTTLRIASCTGGM